MAADLGATVSAATQSMTSAISGSAANGAGVRGFGNAANSRTPGEAILSDLLNGGSRISTSGYGLDENRWSDPSNGFFIGAQSDGNAAYTVQISKNIFSF